MYWLIENLNQLEILKNSSYKEAFIHIIPFNNNIHPVENSVSLIYIKPLESTKGFMISCKHNEGFNIEYDDIFTLLKKFETLYTIDKKEALHHFPLNTLWDINLPPTTYIHPTNITIDWFYNKHPNLEYINCIIPIVKHYELCEEIYNDNKGKCFKSNEKYDLFFNNKTSLAFYYIEKSGLKIDPYLFGEYFYNVDNKEFVYSKFNLKTQTTRPSNSYKGVNFSALNKTNGCRNSFISRNDILLEIDISAYHPTIISFLIKYDFKTRDIHGYFANLYGVEYNEAKHITFQQLYGGVFKKYENLEFFKKTKLYINNMWEEFNREGYIECPISGYKFRKENLENINPQKLFNYLLQCLETSLNTLVLLKIINILKNKKTKLILYTFDSFLFDFDKEEKNIVKDIIEILNNYKLKYKYNYGINYDFKEK